MPEPYLGSPDNPRTAGIICYITLIGWLIAYFALYKDNKNEVSAYHIRQTLLLHIFAFIINILGLLAFWHLFPYIIVSLLSFILFVLWLIGLSGAVRGRIQRIPLVGEWSQLLFSWL